MLLKESHFSIPIEFSNEHKRKFVEFYLEAFRIFIQKFSYLF